MMTRSRFTLKLGACLAAAVAVACLTTVPRPAHADLVLGTVADRPRRAVPQYELGYHPNGPHGPGG